MTIKWLVQRSVGPDDQQASQITAAIRKQGMECVEAKYIPFGGGYETKHIIPYTEDDCVLFFGTIQMYRYLYRTTKWKLGWANFDDLRCHVYYDYLGQYLLDPDYIMLPLREVMRRRSSLYASRDKIFIRPDDNAKSFNGEVIADKELDEWFSYVTHNAADRHSVCVIADVKEIEAEWRLVVADRRVIAGSRYRLFGSVEWAPGYEPGAAKLAEEIAFNGWQPHPIYCIDIAKTKDGYKLIEIGSVNTCGFYECELEPIIKEMSRIAERELFDT